MLTLRNRTGRGHATVFARVHKNPVQDAVTMAGILKTGGARRRGFSFNLSRSVRDACPGFPGVTVSFNFTAYYIHNDIITVYLPRSFIRVRRRHRPDRGRFQRASFTHVSAAHTRRSFRPPPRDPRARARAALLRESRLPLARRV